METMLQNAIDTATSPYMIGFFLGALVFLLGFVPSVGAKLVTSSLDEI